MLQGVAYPAGDLCKAMKAFPESMSGFAGELFAVKAYTLSPYPSVLPLPCRWTSARR